MSRLAARSAVLLILALLLAACGTGDTTTPATEAVTTTMPAAETTVATLETTTTVAPVEEDPLAPFLTFTEIVWEGCELLPIADGSNTAACGYRTHPFFENWLVQVRYEVDDQGNKTGVFGDTIHGYGPTCEWDLPEGEMYTAPLVDGIATYEGVLLGTGQCEGLQWSFTQVWDDAALTLVTSGPIERLD